MFLEEVNNPNTIIEAPEDYGRKLYFDYRKKVKGQEVMSSPSPVVLHLGTWRMKDRYGVNKKFICGINLAYLDDETELVALQEALPQILKSPDMKTRYRVGKNLLPDIFDKAYRTYNVNNLVTRPVYGRFYALKPSDDDKKEAQTLASNDGLEWSQLNNKERNQYIDQALRKRGESDIKRQKDAKKDREAIDDYIQDKGEEEDLDLEPEPEPKSTRPQPKRFKSLELGPGYEAPKLQPDPSLDTTQSPIRSVQSGLPMPQNIKVKKPEPESGQSDIVEVPDETKPT